ncbi:hypothetical protein [Nonomuraea sp. NPDC049400]|uniref:hypothetical protein n=1 Tax=Nonomuraea sp. NPDC049400 TaxID=3364352 RepID=UPI0037A59D5D
MRTAVTRLSGTGMEQALDRASYVLGLGTGAVDCTAVAPVKLSELARFGMMAKAFRIEQLEKDRRLATLLATVRQLEGTAVDDVLPLFDLLMSTVLLARAGRAADKEKLRNLPRLRVAASRLATAWTILLETPPSGPAKEGDGPEDDRPDGEQHVLPQRYQQPPRHPVPARPPAAEPAGELEGAQDSVAGGGEDVQDHGGRRVEEPRVRGCDLRTGEQLGQPDGTGDQRDDGERDQPGGHEPAVATPGGTRTRPRRGGRHRGERRIRVLGHGSILRREAGTAHRATGPTCARPSADRDLVLSARPRALGTRPPRPTPEGRSCRGRAPAPGAGGRRRSR